VTVTNEKDSSGCGCGEEDVTLVFPCSGASNVGQLTNELALRMTREGMGRMSCLAGVGAHLDGFVVAAKDCGKLVVLDGCPVGCAGKIFEHVGIKPHVQLVLTEHGFQKRHGVPPQSSDVDRGLELVLANVKGAPCLTAS
jgi:uncharacterized metal-binding protein